ncbi:FAD-dependent oxidoreductase [Rehaibacterium terrae]|jgi:2-octaprenyl-3-methyl-6-methoxy-1,4-benzoquinol hydroxylase|uniref:2-octaprenyl-3-methyl-6-methoxy-1,4-benzoquinol hydroxylase n=1 Tax=Rehaibacterium terrae TaxID=1341696 RepID=A0A7W7Y1Q9_9GAMM|nr:FAD-dependent oxidoreductase [Rehaibacterium terrae]MBB5016511.1 2-octaprenyl-3-methyl-6-methoxy-1,4-benzoquinol hydroxylase [Rehaibacterium terrae]
MSRREPFDIAVVGAGVVGAAAALAFARDGRRVALVEAREPAPWRADTPDLRVYAFAPDNAALLDSLGVWRDVLAARAQPYRHMRVWDAAGGGELAFHAEALGRDELGWIVEHGLLVDRLWQAIVREPGIVRHCPDHVVALEQDEHAATLELHGGARLKARLVVAADGADSKLRELAGLAVDRHDYGQRGLVAYVRCQRPHRDTAWQRFLPTGPLAFLPCADGRCSIVWTLPDDEAARLLAIDDAAFCRELSRAFDATLGEVVEVSRRVAFPLRRQLADDYVAGRVVLAGDAAHAVHPLAGQGVNLGLRDVACLRRIVAGAGRHDIGTGHRLARYRRERRSDNTLSAWAFDGINRVFSNEALLPTLLRGHLLGLAGRMPPLARLLARRAAGI